jgi:Family of unknown function (DUF6498)
MPRAVRTISILVGVIANLLPLYGVLHWQWDAFQLLMLYWTETVIIAFWTILGIRRLPADRLGTITVNGRDRPATHASLTGYFSLIAGVFILGHLFLLWMMFSSEWLKTVSDSSSVLWQLFITDRLWLAAAVMLASAWISYLSSPPQVGPPRVERDTAGTSPPTHTAGSDAVGDVVGGLLARIAIMQVGIIVGGMLAKTYGSSAPLLIIIGCKTLLDIGSQVGGSATRAGRTTP